MHGRRESASARVPTKRPNKGSHKRGKTSRPREPRRRSGRAGNGPRAPRASQPGAGHRAGQPGHGPWTGDARPPRRGGNGGRRCGRMSTPGTDGGRPTTASIMRQRRGWRARQGPPTGRNLNPTFGSEQTAGSGEPTRRHRGSASPSRKLMGASAPSARRRWQTPASSGRQSRCSTPSTSQSCSGSRPVPAQAAARVGSGHGRH
jgi:hypothetical protein